jgi:hypothetical protein
LGKYEEGRRQVTALLENAVRLRVPSSFQGTDLKAVTVVARRDPRIAVAVQQATGGKITQFLAGSQKQLERYEAATTETRAIILAAIDARRFGHGIRLPTRFLLEAAPGYIDDGTWDRLGTDWDINALDTASLDWRGLDGPISQIKPRPHELIPEEPEYRLADVIEQVGTVRRQFRYPPEQFWVAAVHHTKTGAELTALAQSARSRGRFHHAAQLYLAAANLGDSDALLALSEIRNGRPDKGPFRRGCFAASSGWAAACTAWSLGGTVAGAHTPPASGRGKCIYAQAHLYWISGEHQQAIELYLQGANKADGDAVEEWAWQLAEAGDARLAGHLRRYGLTADGRIEEAWSVGDVPVVGMPPGKSE